MAYASFQFTTFRHVYKVQSLLEPRSKPALCLRCLLFDNGIELVGGSIDLGTSLVVFLLSFRLGLLILPLCVGAEGIKFLRSLSRLGIGFVSLLELVHIDNRQS